MAADSIYGNSPEFIEAIEKIPGVTYMVSSELPPYVATSGRENKAQHASSSEDGKTSDLAFLSSYTSSVPPKPVRVLFIAPHGSILNNCMSKVFFNSGDNATAGYQSQATGRHVMSWTILSRFDEKIGKQPSSTKQRWPSSEIIH